MSICMERTLSNVVYVLKDVSKVEETSSDVKTTFEDVV